MGHAEVMALARRDRALLVAARLRRAAPDRLGLLRAARRERRDQARRAPGDVDLRQHRDAGRVVPPLRHLASTGRAGCTPPTRSTTAGRSGCSCASASAGWPTASARRSTGAPTTRPCWPTSRSSPGMCERCGAEVTKRELTQWYFKVTDYAQRLLDDMDAAGGHLARAGAGHAAQLDRPLRGRARRLRRSSAADEASRSRSSPPGRTRCSARRSSWSPPTRRWPTSCARPSSARRSRPTCDEVRKADRHRPAVHRPAEDRRRPGRHAINPVNGEQIPVCAADYVLADYGTGAIMAVPGARPARPGLRARRSACRSRVVVDTGGEDPERDRRRRRPATAAASTTRSAGRPGARPTAIATIIELAGGARAGRGAVNFRLRDWLLSRQRYWGCPIPIVHCPACGEVAGARRPAAGRAARPDAAPT